VDKDDVSRWFDEYVEAFQACGRGERDARSLLGYWGVPLLLATNEGFMALATEVQVVGAAQQQIDAMRAAAYDRSEVLGSEVTVLNAASALFTAEISWQRADRDEIRRPTVTFLLTGGSVGRRISALVPHSS
jgi:hypothetical protein